MIDHRLLEAYIAELDALRGHGRDFSQAYPDIAARLDIGPRASRDAHVERVVESSAFLAARLRLVIDEVATELPLSILTILAPALIEPIPSMAIAEIVNGTAEKKIPRGTRFDTSRGGDNICFQTTMPITVAPIALRTELLDFTANSAAGLTIHCGGFKPPDPLVLYLGANHRTAALVMDALDENLSSIHIVSPNGEVRRLPRTALQIHGFAPSEASLPVRRAAHPAHRIVTEFMVFPEKFRFISINDGNIESGGQIQFRFNNPLRLMPPLPLDLFAANRVPVVNLWSTGGTPIDINGRQLEYPISVDTLRYRTVECHSVTSVKLFSSTSKDAQIIDPIIALGDIVGSKVRWGVRRSISAYGGEIMLYFDGLDFRALGRERKLAVPLVIASNRDIAQYLAAGTKLTPLEGLGTWQARLTMPPSPPRNANLNQEAMTALVGYLRSGMIGLVHDFKTGALRDYLRRFPGGQKASWIDSIGAATIEPVTALRRGQAQTGTSIRIRYDSSRQTTTSRAMVRRVLGQLLESQRGLNRVEEVSLDAF